MIVSILPEPDKHPLWPAIENMLKPACEDGSVFDAEADVLWLAIEGGTVLGAATTRLRTDGVARLRLVAGTRLKDWMGVFDRDATSWARLCGASKMVARGRAGWARFAERFGWVALDFDDGKRLYEKVLRDG